MDAGAGLRWGGMFLAWFAAGSGWAAECRFQQTADTPTGFTAVVKLRNQDSWPVMGWTVWLAFPDGARITAIRNASLSGDNPYEASSSLRQTCVPLVRRRGRREGRSCMLCVHILPLFRRAGAVTRSDDDCRRGAAPRRRGARCCNQPAAEAAAASLRIEHEREVDGGRSR